MEEKKLTGEEIVELLGICPTEEYCTNDDCPLRNLSCHTGLMVAAKQLIHSLQAENGKQVRMRCDMQRKYDDLQTLCVEQKAEIERLTELQKDSCLRAVELALENAELQKQVDELTEQRNKNYLKGEIIMKDEKTLLNEIKEQCGDCEAWSGTDCTRNPYTQGCLKDEKQVIECHGMLKGCDMVKQAVKDTAKEIFTDLLKEFSIRKSCGNADVVVREMASRKGVEVE